ncbi:uncharacterized protein MONBRDRAFT_24169 [Monosiga brevicollis MX1]|uniref:NlpC/P60 domain-containing protein n=1 Tax=Monosiga brevicollis TaxID=81824 RepID=A9UVL2_MONBE|nr:uncharacterized protein MONBRDRAFT_24169 [Monosiga brevicollis MX1]EDQ90416.1 predicted protein [Monosiga brevicollis MX1]|eukprot:XP_001744467.1 hypothetical protein [Monosiga brevicollis MX1]
MINLLAKRQQKQMARFKLPLNGFAINAGPTYSRLNEKLRRNEQPGHRSSAKLYASDFSSRSACLPTVSSTTYTTRTLMAHRLFQIKSYMGIPYSRKYHRDPSYCCGLVRQALRDLEKEFGFSVGPWNQAYQFDTLPVALTPETMQPGDLVFISGDYFRPTKRTQRHQMVHVEVWLGEGEKTIGARHQTGVIQVHDSYKFVSKSYGNMQFYFRSIDTWLDGVCKSHCTEHDWLSKAERRNKYSLFGTSGIEASQDLLGNAQDATDTAREEEADQDADIAASDDDELE